MTETAVVPRVPTEEELAKQTERKALINSGEQFSKMRNEYGREIEFYVFARNNAARPDNTADVAPASLTVKARVAGTPGWSTNHQWTVEEARELHRLLSKVFPPALASPVVAGITREEVATEFKRLHDGARGCEFDLVPSDGPIAKLALFMHDNGDAILALLTPSATVDRETRSDIVRETVERCAKVAESAGRSPVGAGDGGTYLIGTSLDAARALRALLTTQDDGDRG